ncbi:MAG: serine/threonine protein kinase [Pirellulales bacterium]|nr:serine/threonine protein kinase [Pirellulales bacterium]
MTDDFDSSLEGVPTRSRDLIGQTIGDYRIMRRLGRGAMAEVYLAEQMSLSRWVALKVLLPNLASDESYVRRFRNEATAAAALIHANIVQIYEVGHLDGIYFIAQEYVPGRNLGDVIRRTGPLDPSMVVAVLRQVTAALIKADEHGIVHRDIKPENLLLARSGEVKVADFGLARASGEGVDLTQVGITMGTPLYMSPEQVQGDRLDTRSDIYSLGATCYHLLAGRPPFDGETALSVAVQHINSGPTRLEVERPDLPEGLARIIHKMLAKKPRDRYANGRELLADLRTLPMVDSDSWDKAAEEWSTAELMTLADQQNQATSRLSELMKTTTALRHPDRTWWLLAAAAVCLFIGASLEFIFRPAFLLRDAEAASVQPRDSAWAELYHAKLVDTEAAWKNVKKFHPDDMYYHHLADMGLLRKYLSTDFNLTKTLEVAERLANAGDADTKFQAIGFAGMCIAHGLLQQPKEVAKVFERMAQSPKMFDELQAEPVLFQKFWSVISTHDKELQAIANEQFQRLKAAAEEATAEEID